MPQRGLNLDVGRKHFTLPWLLRLITTMGALGLNQLHLHLNDSGGYAIASARFPDLQREQHLTRDQLTPLVEHAEGCGVVIIPESDTPSHGASLLGNRPELHLTSAAGVPDPDRLDITLPAARAFVRDLWDEILEIFPGPYAHLGGDEFLPAPWEEEMSVQTQRYPQLLQWARTEAGATASIHDAYALYVNELAGHLQSRGRTVKMWNDHIRGDLGLVRIDPTIEVDVWIRWNAGQPAASDIARAGHPVVNANGDYLYFILSSTRHLPARERSRR